MRHARLSETIYCWPMEDCSKLQADFMTVSRLAVIGLDQWFSTSGPWPTGRPWKHFEMGHGTF